MTIQSAKFKQVIAPAAITDNASFTTNSIDTKGFGYATIIVNIGATDIAMTALKVQESDDDSSYADITASVVGTATDAYGSATSLPSATDDNNVVVFQVNLRNRKRYLDLVATAGNGSTGTYASAVCVLTEAQVSPDALAATGAETIMRF